MLRYFPRIGAEHISLRQIDSHEHILSAFDRTIALYATEHFRRSGIDLVLSCRVRASFPVFALHATAITKGVPTCMMASQAHLCMATMKVVAGMA